MKKHRFSAQFRKLLRARIRHLRNNRPEGFYRAALDFAGGISGDGLDIINPFVSADVPWFNRGHAAWRGRTLA